MNERFLNDHLLEVEHQPHRALLLVREKLLHVIEAMEELLPRGENAVVGDGNAHDAAQDGAGDLHGAPLDRKDALEPPPPGFRKREKTHRFSGGRGIDHDHVVVAAVMVLGDPEKARELVHPRKNGELFSKHVVETAPLEDTLHIALDRSPVAADVVVHIGFLAPKVFHDVCRLAAERNIEGVGERVSDVGRDDKRALPSLCR